MKQVILTCWNFQLSHEATDVGFNHSFIPRGLNRTRKWPAPNVSGFTAQHELTKQRKKKYHKLFHRGKPEICDNF